MPIHLHITFGGLCMLVHDRGRLHVLLPVPHHEHDVCVLYRTQHEDANAPDDQLVKLPFERSRIDLTKLPYNGPPEPMHPNVVDLTANSERWVRRDILDDPGASADVRAWVKMGTGRWHHHSPGASWRLHGHGPQHMATWEERRIKDVGTTPEGENEQGFELKVDGQHPALKILRPIEGEDNVVRVYVLHVPPGEIPPRAPVIRPPTRKPDPGDEACHFSAFYRLLVPSQPETVPVFDNAPGKFPTEPGRPRGREFTCIMARADPQP